jgi:molybdenum cofactor guanylyltransferase
VNAVAVAGAVLTGGASSRMGSDKALLVVDGEALVWRQVSTLMRAGADPVVAIGGDRVGLGHLGLRVVADVAPGGGPLVGIATALGHFASTSTHVAIVACDMPRLDVDTVSRLVDTARADTRADVVAAAQSGRAEPLCAVWRVATARPLVDAALAAGERAVHQVLGTLALVSVEIDSSLLLNVNRPRDLEGL